MSITLDDASSLIEYIEIVLRTYCDWRGKSHEDSSEAQNLEETWFRGESKASYELLPGAYRKDWQHDTMFNRFRAAGVCALDHRPQSEWEWYFAAQHYELPTRLLDWTTDPLAALFFALRGMNADSEDLTYDDNDSPVVWIMDAGSLNKVSYGADEVVTPVDGGEFSKYWLPSKILSEASTFEYTGCRYTNEKPIAIWPAWTTPRITAQSGCFTVHGTEKIAIESLFESPNDRETNPMLKIAIKSPKRVSRELADLGINRLRFFPELQNLAGKLRRDYKP